MPHPLPVQPDRKFNLFGLTLPEMLAELAPILVKPYQIRSLYKALYLRRVTDFTALTDLPLAARSALSEKYAILHLAIEAQFPSRDGTVRFLLRLEDGKSVEGVYIPDGERVTFCLSSQVGCALACSFCMTGKLGFSRNLTTGEILGALFTMREALREEMKVTVPEPTAADADEPARQVGEEKPFNIVFMGQGEPFLNRRNLWAALEILTDPEGGQISWRRVTVSTAGILDGIKEWAVMARRPRLALSLTTAIPEQRNQLMPINETFPLEEILAFLRTVEWRSNERVFLEFPLLAGVNTSPAHANALARALQGIPSKINLIPWNPAPELPLGRPDDAEVQEFQDRLIQKGFTATVRKSKGQDIYGACGQLHALTTAGKRGAAP